MLNRFEWLSESQVFNWFEINFIYFSLKLFGIIWWKEFDRDKKWVFFFSNFLCKHLFNFSVTIFRTKQRNCFVEFIDIISVLFRIHVKFIKVHIFLKSTTHIFVLLTSNEKHIHNLSAYSIPLFIYMYPTIEQIASVRSATIPKQKTFKTNNQEKKNFKKTVQIKISVYWVLNQFLARNK